MQGIEDGAGIIIGLVHFGANPIATALFVLAWDGNVEGCDACSAYICLLIPYFLVCFPHGKLVPLFHRGHVC